MSNIAEKREFVCISCPIGCRLEAEQIEDGSFTVTGNQCPKGEDYAREEINTPKRIVTTTVVLEGAQRLRVPVRTDLPLPVEKIQALLYRLHGMSLKGPVSRGNIVVEDFERTGVNVIASLSVENHWE